MVDFVKYCKRGCFFVDFEYFVVYLVNDFDCVFEFIFVFSRGARYTGVASDKYRFIVVMCYIYMGVGVEIIVFYVF